MSLTAQIGASEATFKLSQKIVSSLAEKFSFKFEDGWSTVSSRTLENIQKRLKRDKRRANPASSIKHPRTAFSFFTQKQRPLSQAAHPEATFGQLSRFVSEAWKLLTPEQMASFKALELADKERYQVERATVLATAGAAPSAEVVEAPVAAEATKEKKVRKVKAKTEEGAAPVAATPAVEAAPATPAPKKAKSAKAAVPAATPVEAAPAPVEAAPAKKAKTPKAAATPAAEAAPVEAKPAEVKAAKPASAKPKAVKA